MVVLCRTKIMSKYMIVLGPCAGKLARCILLTRSCGALWAVNCLIDCLNSKIRCKPFLLKANIHILTMLTQRVPELNLFSSSIVIRLIYSNTGLLKLNCSAFFHQLLAPWFKPRYFIFHFCSLSSGVVQPI